MAAKKLSNAVPMSAGPKVPKAARDEVLKTAKGDGDVVVDVRGAHHLSPQEQKIISKGGPIRKAIQMEKPKEDLDAVPPWHWNPTNAHARMMPAGVSEGKYQRLRKMLRSIDVNLDITMHGERHVWQVWFYKPGFSSYGNGWVMAMEFKPHQGTDYIMKCLQHADCASNGTPKERWQKGKDMKEAHLRKKREERKQRDADIAASVYDYTSIKNIGLGSKSVNYH